jgi:hypothetical protein
VLQALSLLGLSLLRVSAVLAEDHVAAACDVAGADLQRRQDERGSAPTLVDERNVTDEIMLRAVRSAGVICVT